MLTRKQLSTFRRNSDMAYKARVTGRFRGTTDEIIQWAAAKHGIDARVKQILSARTWRKPGF